ncbi:MAG TPA: Na+/H+ antiporter NhaC family protein [Longimicrobiales bacterium]|nr:Na+/H+ antiporter NhaC family protein [Longimicrobiales bacterium]
MEVIDPGWLSIVPPLAAIAAALVFREVVISLFAGVWLGALFLANWNPITATLRTVDQFMVGALFDADHVSIIIFTLLLGGMVGVMSRSGGTLGIVEALRPYATSRRRGQLLTWLAGLVIFFDDYSNTLIVGNTFRPVTDRLRISREKLAYIVDSTAAPMAAIAVVSTWVGFEISLIAEALGAAATQATDPALAADLQAGASNPFTVFLHSIPYLFYPILALLFVAMTVVTRREFGPMLVAERRAAAGDGVSRPGASPASSTDSGLLEPDEGTPHRWANALVPVLVVILVVVAGIWTSGAESLGPGDHTLWEVVGAGDPYKSLLWGSMLGALVAIVMATAQRLLRATEAVEAFVGGMRAMMMAMIILTLAWSIGDVTEALGTGPYLTGVLSEALPLWSLPALVTVVAAAVAFATGSSWGTMAILFPVVIPLAVSMGAGASFDGGGHYTILLGAISSIMAGSIFGDHCSPISDTTVMSSLASACDHVDHVRTQLPYALTVAVIAILVGDIGSAIGLPPWLSILIGLGLLYAVLRLAGRPVDEGGGEALHVGATAAGEATSAVS